MKWVTASLLSVLACAWVTPGAASRHGSLPCRVDDPEYIGVSKCKTCHFKEWMSWKKTPMAKAFKTLAPGQKVEQKKEFGLDPEKDYRKDPTCLECHTTGYGKPGGYPSLDPDRPWTEEQKERAGDMEGVQCEVCHGPGSLTAPYKKENEQYAKAELLKRGLVEPRPELCATCHNERSPSLTEDSRLDYDGVLKDQTKIHQRVPLRHQH